MIYSGGTVILGTIFLSRKLTNSTSDKSVCNHLPSWYSLLLSIFKTLQKISLAVGNLPVIWRPQRYL